MLEEIKRPEYKQLPELLYLRAFNKKDKSFYYLVSSLKLQEYGQGVYGWSNGDTVYPMQSVFECDFWEAPQRLIGIKDSEGKKIFEGDILEYPKKIEEGYHRIKIEYKYHALRAYVPGMDEYWELYGIVNSEGKCPYRIIGNIYETPELLKDGE